MKRASQFLLGSLMGGLLVVVPVYLSLLLLLKAMGSLVGLVKPLARILPAWSPGEEAMAFLLILAVVIVIGAAVRTPAGRALREKVERSIFGRVPGYDLLRGLAHRLAGEGVESAWKPALAEIEEALVPAFIIEELPDGRFTVFVPSVPTPLAGAVYILTPERVHPLDVPFTQAIKAVSRWGAGSKDLVAAMKPVA